MGIDALYLAIVGRYGIVGTAAPAVPDMFAALAFPVHVLLELAHTDGSRGGGKVLLEG